MPNFDYETEPLDEMEDVLGVFYGGRGQWGQQFVVTNRRLLMGPIDTGIAMAVNAYVLNQALPGVGAGGLLKDVLSQYAPKNPSIAALARIGDLA